MKALRTKICTYAIALLASIGFASPTLAGSSDFAGLFIAAHAELNVVAIPGTHTAGAAGADADGGAASGSEAAPHPDDDHLARGGGDGAGAQLLAGP